MVNRRTFVLTLAACATAWAAPGVTGKSARDVLDMPAARSPLAAGALLNGLARAGNRIIAVGQRGHALWSDDAGQSWKQAEVPVSSDLVAVSFPVPATGWAVGHDGVVLKSTDAGQTWSLQLDGRRLGEVMVEYYQREAGASLASDPKRAAAVLEEAKRFQLQGAENPLLDVWFSDASNGIVVGAFGLVLRTTDSGASWQPMLHLADNPKSLHLYAVRGIGADVYIAGEQGLMMRLDRDSGRFQTVELPYKGTMFGVTGNERAVVAHGLRGSVLRSTDGGRSWQHVTTGLQVGLTASALDDDGRIVIVSQTGHVLSSRDDGASFTAAPLKQTLPAAAVVAAAKGALVIAGPRGARALALP